MSANTPATRLATRLCFFAAGFALACWAPLVPFAKDRLGLGEAALGLLLLALGAGSLAAMPLAGGLVARVGSKALVLGGGVGLALALPLMASTQHLPTMALALLLFGASLGSLDVAMNVHAVAVEGASDRPLMSGFHGLFSLGGVVGSGGISGLLALGLGLPQAAWAAVGLIALALVVAAPRLLPSGQGPRGPWFAWPRGLVLWLSALAFVCFLVEGAMLDWSALLLTQTKGFPAAQGGLAFALFSVSMTLGRLGGDALLARVGTRRVLAWGGLVASLGLALACWAPGGWGLGAFGLVGLGAANVVPVLFSAAGRQQAMPSHLAVAAVSGIGYAGVLAGPALLGLVAQAFSLPLLFAALGLVLLLVPLSAPWVAPR